MLRKLRAELTANSDYVGPKFPEEARKIHFDEAPGRAIHGEATLRKRRSLTRRACRSFPCRACPRTRTRAAGAW